VIAIFIVLAAAAAALIAFVVIVSRTQKPVTTTAEEVAEAIETFLEGRGSSHDWDDFISIPIADPALEAIRLRCGGLPEEFPSRDNHQYCSLEGEQVLRTYVAQLRGRAA